MPYFIKHRYPELIEEYGITQEDLSKIIHKSRSQIANTLRLLQLSDYVIEKLSKSQISQGHAKVLVGLDEKDQHILCDTIVGQKLSVRETEQLVNDMKPGRKPEKRNTEKTSNGFDLSAYRELIQENVPFRINVKRSKVEISFENEEELKKFIKKMAQEV